LGTLLFLRFVKNRVIILVDKWIAAEVKQIDVRRGMIGLHEKSKGGCHPSPLLE